MQKQTQNRLFMTVTETVAYTGCPRSTILKYSKIGQFPKQIRLLGTRIVFNRADVQAWIDSRLDASKEAANDE